MSSERDTTEVKTGRIVGREELFAYYLEQISAPKGTASGSKRILNLQ